MSSPSGEARVAPEHARFRLRELLSPAVYLADDRGRSIAVEAAVFDEYDAEDEEPSEDGEGDSAEGADPSEATKERGSGANGEAASRQRRGLRKRATDVASVVTALCFVLAMIGGTCFLGWKVSSFVAGVFKLPAFAGPFVVVAAFFVLAPIYRLTFGKAERKKRAPLAAASALVRARCGGCGYSLQEVAPEADGCTPCPECGAAWRLDAWRRGFPRERREVEVRDAKNRSRHTWATLEDARKCRTPLLAGRSFDEVRAMVNERAPRAALPWSSRVAYALVLLVPAVLALLAASAATGQFSSFSPWAVVLPAAILAVVGVLIRRVAWTVRRGLASIELAAEFVGRGVCPACEGELDSERSIGDGAVVCRGCGAAWKPAPEG